MTETSENTSFQLDQYGGIQATDGSLYEKFRLISSIEKQAMLSLMMDFSGLREDQIATNSWGFPFMPIPEPRRANGRFRLAPTTTKPEFLGHPIYWLDPALSERLPSESDEYWSIRMYYLLRAAGYWSDQGRADFLRYHDFSFSPGDLEAYHLQHNPEIETDRSSRFDFINEDDIKCGMDEVDKVFTAAMEKCSKSLQKELSAFMERQIIAFAHAKEIIGPKYMSSNLAVDDSSGLWATSVQPELDRISQQYDQLLVSGGRLSDLTDEALEVFTKFQEMVVAFSYISTTLSIPVVRNLGTPSESYSHMVSYMGLAASQTSHREGSFNVIDPLVEAFDSRTIGAIDRVVTGKAWVNYVLVWKQMRLALVNYLRMKDGEETFGNYSELEVHLVQQSPNLDYHSAIVQAMEGEDDDDDEDVLSLDDLLSSKDEEEQQWN